MKNILFPLVLIVLTYIVLLQFTHENQNKTVPATVSSRVAEQSAHEFIAPTGKSDDKTGLPSIRRARLLLGNENGRNFIKTVIETQPSLDSRPTVLYEWRINGENAGNSDTISVFKRGDQITVALTPIIGEKKGHQRTLSLKVDNAAPVIEEHYTVRNEGSVLTYQVKASDPDGDPLVYALIDAPSDMSIDQNGLIKWTVPKDAPSKSPVKLKVSDGKGGETLFAFEITLN